jgi:CRP-like cAMP-binding protein
LDPIELLAGTHLFHTVPRTELETLRPHLRTQAFTRGAYLFHEGDPGNRLFVIASGEVKISRTRRSGEESVFALMRAGDLLGELALFSRDVARTADAQALEATDCVTLGREPLLEFVRTRPDLLLDAVAGLVDSIRRKDEAIVETAFLDIPGRVARTLLALAERHGRPAPEGTQIGAKLSQRTLAGMVGASRENVNRALNMFAAQGDLKLEGGVITVVRPEALRRRAG